MITTGNVPDWMIEGRTTLLMKDPTKGSEVSNYRPIACLNFLWKLLTAMIREIRHWEIRQPVRRGK